MILIVGAPSLLGYSVIKKLNKQNFNYLVLSGEDPVEITQLTDDSFQFLHYLENSSLERWITHTTEEIEFIVWCDPIDVTKNLSLFNALWQLGYQYQIPFAAVVKDDPIIHDIALRANRPFFWVMLVVNYLYNLNECFPLFKTSNELNLVSQPTRSKQTAENPLDNDEEVATTFAPDVAEVAYHFIRNRKQSGLYRLPFQRLSGDSLSQTVINSRLQHLDTRYTEWPREAIIAADKLSETGFNQPFTSLQQALDQFR